MIAINLRSKINKILILNIAVIIFSIIAFISPKISPAEQWLFGFIGYSIPFMLLANFVFIIYWLINKKPFFLFSILTLISGWTYVKRTFQISLPAKSEGDFKIFSYNCRYFNSGPEEMEKDEDGLLSTVNAIYSVNADILCFQEFYNNPATFANTKNKFINMGYSHFAICNININNSNDAGLAIFSKYPIIRKGTFSLSKTGSNKALYSDLVINNDTVRVYNLHLSSIRFSSHDNMINYLKKIRRGFQRHPEEVRIILQHLDKSSQHVIICADLNDLPYGYSYQKINERLNNSFESSGNGFDFTYRENIPFLRIDNQFSGTSIKILNHEVLKDFNNSDHFPILVTYKMK